MSRFQLPCLLASLAFAASAGAATIVIQVDDLPGEGFNDPTVVAPVPGNPATTIGEQRLAVFERAAQIWGQRLQSPVTIVVGASFAPLDCLGDSAVLGAAGPNGFRANFTGAVLPGYWYPEALADALSGTNFAPGDADILAEFNGDLDTGTCLTGVAGWYYGLDAGAAPPEDRTPLLPVVLHELGHGLGFVSIVDEQSGQYAGQGQGLPDVWTAFQFDLGTSLFWDEMNNAQRAASAIGDPELAWDGPAVNAALADELRPPGMLTVDSPPGLAGDYPDDSAGSAFGTPPPLAGLSGELVQSQDGAASGSSFDACDPITNAAALDGKIAFVDRGNCLFSIKARNVEAAGAIGMVVANLEAPPNDGAFVMAGDYDISIPGVLVATTLGDSLFFELQGGTVNVTLRYDNSEPLQGSNGGLVRLYAPDPLELGSSVSHFSEDTSPNLLMEPSINSDLFDDVDLTLPLFEDIGWNIVTEPRPDGIFADGFED